MKKTTSVNPLENPITAALLAIIAAASPARAAVNLLVDSGFESNPLGTYSSVLTGGVTGVWGDENSTIVTSENGVSPFNSLMLRVAGSSDAWQTVQLTELSSGTWGDIDLGNQSYDLNARFNLGTAVLNKIGQVIISFYSGNGVTGPTGLLGTSNSVLNLNDDSTRNWETIRNTGLVPVGTRFVLSQVVFRNDANAMGSDVGYVDNASLTIVPEPSASALLGLGSSALLFRRRRLS